MTIQSGQVSGEIPRFWSLQGAVDISNCHMNVAFVFHGAFQGLVLYIVISSRNYYITLINYQSFTHWRKTCPTSQTTEDWGNLCYSD